VTAERLTAASGNAKFKIPNSKQIPNPKFKIPNLTWNLERALSALS
jgi:hypothetical protein